MSMKINQIPQVEECAFEPDSIEVRCVECGKPTGTLGTCADIDFCAKCREDYVDVCMAEGMSVKAANVRLSEMLITMIEGQGYKSKYKPKRVLHLSVNDNPACGVQGGPHPLTTNINEANCKRCLSAGRQN